MDDWGRVPLRTQLTATDLRNLTVAPWLEKFRSPPSILNRPALSPFHLLHDVVKSDLQVCPLCLQEQPYLRLMWRLAPVHACLHHRSLLQAHCHRCGASLTISGQTQHHLRCGVCDMDLRLLPVVEASADLLMAQQRREPDLRFLLDPAVRLVRPGSQEEDAPVWDLPQAIGLKFRYVRLQAGLSVAKMAQKMGTWDGLLTRLEVGRRSPLLLYWTYLEALSMSWPDFAALEVPPDFVRTIQEPPQMHLRLCPNPECPNHQPPPSTRVVRLANYPQQQIARFHCLTCGRRFTRAYDGKLRFKSRKPPIGLGEPPPMVKPAEDIARLKEMGLRGKDNRWIARQLGWGEKTVRIHWISLGMEEQVHRAQAQRRAQEQQQRDANRRACVEAVLQTMLNQDEEITASRVGRALGHGGEYLRSYPDLLALVQEAVQPHNAQVRQRRYETLTAQIIQALEGLKKSTCVVSLGEVSLQVGMRSDRLSKSYPELSAMIRQAVEEHQVEVKARHTQMVCAQINEVAAHLVAEGSRLTWAAILKGAGLNRYGVQNDPVIHNLIQQWLGGFDRQD